LILHRPDSLRCNRWKAKCADLEEKSNSTVHIDSLKAVEYERDKFKQKAKEFGTLRACVRTYLSSKLTQNHSLTCVSHCTESELKRTQVNAVVKTPARIKSSEPNLVSSGTFDVMTSRDSTTSSPPGSRAGTTWFSVALSRLTHAHAALTSFNCVGLRGPGAGCSWHRKCYATDEEQFRMQHQTGKLRDEVASALQCLLD